MINSLFIALVRYRALQAIQRERESSQYFLLEESWEGVLILAKSMYGERESGKREWFFFFSFQWKVRFVSYCICVSVYDWREREIREKE